MCKLLVVSDEPDQLQEIVRVARQAEILDIVTATNEEDAYERIASQDFCLAVVDIMLSKPDLHKEGLRVIRQLRRDQPQCRIIALTARGHNDEGIEALRDGADDFICAEWKYINWQELLRQRLILWRGVATLQYATPA